MSSMNEKCFLRIALFKVLGSMQILTLLLAFLTVIRIPPIGLVHLVLWLHDHAPHGTIYVWPFLVELMTLSLPCVWTINLILVSTLKVYSSGMHPRPWIHQHTFYIYPLGLFWRWWSVAVLYVLCGLVFSVPY